MNVDVCDRDSLLASSTTNENTANVNIAFISVPKCYGLWIYRDVPKTVLVASLVSALGGLLFGYDIGIVSGAILQIQEIFHLDCNQREKIIGVMLIGAVIGSIAGGYLMDTLGRWTCIILNGCVFIFGALVLAFASNYGSLIVGRVIVGFAVAISAMAECIYISEIAPSNHRGSLITLNEFFITVGLLLAYLVSYSFITISYGWRIMFGLSAVPAGILVACMSFLPESPRWLLTQKKEEQALKTLRKIREEENVETEFQAIKDSLSSERVYSFRSLFRANSKLRKRMLIVTLLAIFQQLTGQPNILYYASTIFQSIGFTDGSQATLATVGLGVIKLLFTLITLLGIDKIGRRTALIVGSIVMTISLIILGSVSSAHLLINKPCLVNNSVGNNPNDALYTLGNATAPHQTSTLLKVASLVSLMSFAAAYAFGFGPVTWILMSELFPPEIKGRASSIANLMNWLANFLVSSTFLDLADAIGLPTMFFLYGGVCFIAVLFIVQLVPETKGKTLEEISTSLSSPSSLSWRICSRKVPWLLPRLRRQSSSTNEILLQQNASHGRYCYNDPPNGIFELPESPTLPLPNLNDDNST